MTYCILVRFNIVTFGLPYTRFCAVASEGIISRKREANVHFRVKFQCSVFSPHTRSMNNVKFMKTRSSRRVRRKSSTMAADKRTSEESMAVHSPCERMEQRWTWPNSERTLLLRCSTRRQGRPRRRMFVVYRKSKLSIVFTVLE